MEEEKKRLVAFTAASSASGANSGGAIAGPGLPPPMSMGGLAGIPNSLPTLNSAMLAPPAAASQPNPNLGPSNQPVQAAQAQLLSGLLSSFQGTLSGNPNIAAAAQLLQQQLGAVAGTGPPHSAYGAPHPAQPHTGGYPPQQQQQPAPYGAYGAQQPMYPAQGQAAPGPSYPGSTGPPGAGSGAPMHSGYQQQQQYNRPDSDPQRSSSPGNARTLDALVGRMTAGACSSYISSSMHEVCRVLQRESVCLFIHNASAFKRRITTDWIVSLREVCLRVRCCDDAARDIAGRALHRQWTDHRRSVFISVWNADDSGICSFYKKSRSIIHILVCVVSRWLVS